MTSASGKTTEPMSRPSTTPPPRSATHCRWRSTSTARTPGLAATADTAPLTSGPRMASVTSVAVDLTRSPTAMARRGPARPPPRGRPASMPRSRAAQATARYMAPVSRRSRPSRSARARETVDLPEPAGPSMAMTGWAAPVPGRSPAPSPAEAGQIVGEARDSWWRPPPIRSMAVELGRRPGQAAAATAAAMAIRWSPAGVDCAGGSGPPAPPPPGRPPRRRPRPRRPGPARRCRPAGPTP